MILIPERMDEKGVRALQAEFSVDYDPTLVERPGEFLRRLGAAEALIVRKGTQVTAAVLDAAPRLRAVARLGVGLDNIDQAACSSRGIAVIPATNANSRSVAEHVIACAMILLRPAFLVAVETARGDWPRERRFFDREIGGKTLGLIGFGNIGRQTAAMARCLGMDVMAYDPAVPADSPVWAQLAVRRASMDEVISRSDVVSLHVPLTPETRNLMNRERMARMKPSAVLINAARGGIVNEAALAEALRAGRLAGASLDVFDPEPLPRGNPLEGVPNLLLTPHSAGVTVEAEERTAMLIATKVAELLRTPR